jgi:nickel-dependent lactate racemase
MPDRTISVPFGKDETLSLSVPESRIHGILMPNPVALPRQDRVIPDALAHPRNSPTLGAFLADADSVLIIVNDATRPTPTRLFLEALLPDLEGLSVTILVATGIHDALTEDEQFRLFGPLKDRFTIHCHNSRTSPAEHIGDSKNGTPLLINRLVFEHAKVILTGSVEPHYFAGYTGGRKGFMPGVAGYESIERNHAHALHPESKLLSLEHNPVHQDMVDALSVILDRVDVFSIQAVLDGDHNIVAVETGHVRDSFAAAVEACNRIYAVPFREKSDIVVAVCGFPMDSNLYQSQKGLESGKLALEPGGILILVSECRHGLGEGLFAKLLRAGRSPAEVLEKIRGDYVLGAHKAASIAKLASESEIWLYSTLPATELDGLHIRPIPDLAGGIEEALRRKPGGAITFLFSASTLVPLQEAPVPA